MTEDEAQAWLVPRVSHEMIAKLHTFVDLLVAANARQNLIGPCTVPFIWARHIVDSAQLLTFSAIDGGGHWLDLGSGPGLPGIVLAIMDKRPITLVESRRLRSDFLASAVRTLGLDHVTIAAQRLETVVAAPAATISARAFAPLPRLLTLAYRFSTPDTLWLLPKGRSAARELEAIRDSWQGDFRLEPSLTDPESAIIVARDVRSRP